MGDGYHTKYCIIDDRAGLSSGMMQLNRIVDQSVEFVGRTMGLQPEIFSKIAVVINPEGPSEVINGVIFITPRRDTRMGRRGWFELLFSHELTHLLTLQNWGVMLPLLWEGVAIYLGDHRIRKRLFQTGYHHYSKALLNHNALIDLNQLLFPADYYGKRHDFRVDIEAGSFVGFLLKFYGAELLRSAFESYIPPTEEEHVIQFNTIMNHCFGGGLNSLQQEWHLFLERDITAHPAVEEMVEGFPFSEEILHRGNHCNFCFSPAGGDLCPVCDIPVTARVIIE